MSTSWEFFPPDLVVPEAQTSACIDAYIGKPCLQISTDHETGGHLDCASYGGSVSVEMTGRSCLRCRLDKKLAEAPHPDCADST